jgi:hypothetical protein
MDPCVYEAGAFERVLEYWQPLPIPLSNAEQQWLSGLLCE